jgi:hypothetical protein
MCGSLRTMQLNKRLLHGQMSANTRVPACKDYVTKIVSRQLAQKVLRGMAGATKTPIAKAC